MNKKFWFVLVSLLLVCCIALTGCKKEEAAPVEEAAVEEAAEAPAEEAAAEEAAEAPAEEAALAEEAAVEPAAEEAAEAPALKVAMVLSGPINDDDWNSVGYNGLKKACEELGVEYAYSESVADADAERVIRDYASRGYGLIFSHSFSFGEATLKVAKEFPEVIFMAGTAEETSENMGTYDNPDYQGAYLAGMLAAGVSKTGILGWVDGIASPNMLANFHSFEDGAQEMNPDVKVLNTFIGSWYDPAKAKEAAIAQIEQGADILSSQGVGVIDACVEKGAWALGAMTDQNFMGPEVVLTSVLWDLYPCVKNVTQEVIDGTWTNGNRTYGVADGAVYLSDFHGLDSNVPAEVMEKVNAKLESIKAGEFEVPHDTSEIAE